MKYTSNFFLTMIKQIKMIEEVILAEVYLLNNSVVSKI